MERVQKPGVFRSYDGCFAAFLWAIVIWSVMAFLLWAAWKWAT